MNCDHQAEEGSFEGSGHKMTNEWEQNSADIEYRMTRRSKRISEKRCDFVGFGLALGALGMACAETVEDAAARTGLNMDRSTAPLINMALGLNMMVTHVARGKEGGKPGQRP
jgi:hypothetical protein